MANGLASGMALRSFGRIGKSWLRVGAVVGARWRLVRRAGLGAAAALAGAGAAAAQGTVAGQVTIAERAGDITEDLGNVVVTLEPVGAPRSRLAPVRGQIAMERRRFSPGVVVVTPGSTVEFPNRDPFDHNIFTNEPGSEFDAGLYGRGEVASATFRKVGAVPVYCNIHSRMVGHVVVVGTPHVAQAGADGRWSIPRVPAGRYVLRFWHNRAAVADEELAVPAGGLEHASVKLDARGFKLIAHKNKFGQDYRAGGEKYE
jgi:plastocyanin